MSINYVAVTTADSKLVGPITEGSVSSGDVVAIDQKAIHAAITAKTRLAGKRNHTLKFEGPDNGYVFASVLPDHVLVTHNTANDEAVLMQIMDLLSTLTGEGLNVWDPQQGSWFPGSPALKQTKAKSKPVKAKAKPAKRKPAAKAKSEKKSKR